MFHKLFQTFYKLLIINFKFVHKCLFFFYQSKTNMNINFKFVRKCFRRFRFIIKIIVIYFIYIKFIILCVIMIVFKILLHIFFANHDNV